MPSSMGACSVLMALCLASVHGARMEMELGANPIRKVVTLMQNMQKEVEAEGAKEKELFDKFMCFCQGSGSETSKAIADGKAKIDELASKVKEEESLKAQLDQEVGDHKKDRESAKNDLAEAASLRAKEKAEFEAMSADSSTNIEALSKAIPAIEKGMGGASFLQTPNGNQLLRLFQSNSDMDENDRNDVIAFLQQTGSDEAPGSGEILGILKQQKESMEANLKEATEQEQTASAGFASLEASKNKEVEVATEAIETKTMRSGELAVSIVQTKNAHEDTIEEVADNEKLQASLGEQCANKQKEFDAAKKAKAEEVKAIGEAIAILNDDDALDVFKKALPSSALIQQNLGFLQKSQGAASPQRKAQAILATLVGSKAPHAQHLNLLLYSMGSKLRLASKGKAQKFDEIVKMIDDMVLLLKKEQDDDDKQKEFCADELDKAADEEVAAKTAVAQVEAEIDEETDQIATLTDEIKVLQEEVKALDKAVVEATEQRKEEHEEYTAATQMSQAAMQLVEKAKSKLAKFYNPALLQQPQQQETQGAFAFVQVRSHARARDTYEDADDDQDAASYKKSEKSAGVIGLMDMIIRDCETDMKDAEYAEKTAQDDYAKLMSESQETRVQDQKGIADKSATKADLETKLVAAKDAKASADGEVQIVADSISKLHATCDFLIENYGLRKEARTNESEALKNAKAMLSGANFGF